MSMIVTTPRHERLSSRVSSALTAREKADATAAAKAAGLSASAWVRSAVIARLRGEN